MVSFASKKATVLAISTVGALHGGFTPPVRTEIASRIQGPYAIELRVMDPPNEDWKAIESMTPSDQELALIAIDPPRDWLDDDAWDDDEE